MRAHALTYAALVATTFFWGSAFNVAAQVIANMSPITAGAERFMLAAVLLLLFLTLTGRLDWRIVRGHWPALTAVGALGVVGFNLAMFFGLQSTTPFKAALLMATTPLWTLLLAALLEGEPVDRWRMAGLLSGLVGVALVISAGDLAHLATLQFVPGDAIVVCGALSWAAATAISRRYLQRVDAQQTTTWSIAIGSVVLLLLGAWREHPLQAVAAASAVTHLGVAYLAVCGSVLGYLFWFSATRRLGAAHTAAFFNLVPVFTLLISLAGGQAPETAQLLGVAAVVGGVALASRGGRVRQPARSVAAQAQPCT